MKCRLYLWAVVALPLSSPCLCAQSGQNQENAILLSDEFDREEGLLTFYAENQDYCDYYLHLSFQYAEGFTGMASGASTVVAPGEHPVLNYRVQENARGYGYRYGYAMYRGTPYAQVNADFCYALPCADEETVAVRQAEQRDGYTIEFDLPADTVYACRGGVVCDDDLKDFTSKGFRRFDDSNRRAQITLYHDDGTFGEYVFQGNPLLRPGERVMMGEAIAVLASEVSAYQLLFSVCFLDKNKVKNVQIGNKHTHFRPFFQTYNSGKTRLEDGKTYISERHDEMLLQDMSKRERKRFLKNK